MNLTLSFKHQTKKILALAGLLVAGMVMTSLANLALADSKEPELQADERIVSIYDQGEERVIITKSRTVRQALKAAEVEIDEAKDVVEPSLNSEMIASKYNINIYRAKPVTVVDGNLRQRVTTAQQTPEQIAKVADITLHKEDKVKIDGASNLLVDGANLVMTIDRATPINFTLYGKKSEIRTRAKTVGDLLKEKNITVGKNDTLTVSKDTKITKGMKIEIWRNGKQVVTVEEEVDFPIERIQDANRDLGYRLVKEAGTKGKRNVTYEIEMRNGKEVSRKEIASVTTKEPKKQVEVVGAKIEGPEEIMAKIRAAAAAKGIDAQRVLMIARCESHFNPMADSGYYKGIFQHDPRYWPERAKRYGFAGASYFDVDAQIGVSTSMMAGGGWSHWGCDPGPQ